MHGGVGRDGWYPLGAGRKKLLKNGTPAQAVVKSVYWMQDAEDSAPLGSMGIGNERHDLTLEVHAHGGEPYEVQGLFRIPVRLLDRVVEGMTVPVKVHPSKPDRVAVDWEAFVDAGGDPPDPTREEITAVVHDQFPAESRKMMIDGWVAATKGGAMTSDQFEKAIADAVTSGMLNGAEAEAARQAIA